MQRFDCRTFVRDCRVPLTVENVPTSTFVEVTFGKMLAVIFPGRNLALVRELLMLVVLVGNS